VVVHNFDLVGTIVMPHETDSPLVIDSDAVLPLAVALQGFELVSRWDPQARQLSGSV
jgi:hypothetical protein